MPEAIFVRDRHQVRLELIAATGAGELRQLGDGRAGFYQKDVGASSGDFILITTSGQVTLPKTNGVALLDGGRAYWDHSANAITYKPANDRDFFAGVVVGDYAGGDSQVIVNLNVEPRYLLDIARDPWVDAVIGTQALGGLLPARRRGGAHTINITATNEAQKVDILTRDGFDPAAKAIVELIFNVINDGSGTVVDVSMGVANGTDAADADAITESLFVHLNANDVNIYSESDDGTTEVAATDTTIDYTAGVPVEVWLDIRDDEDIQIYVNGALVLGATFFKLNAAAGPLTLLVHVEKSISIDVYELDINRLCARIMEQ